MHFTQYIAPSIILAGSAAASNAKRSNHGYDTAGSQSYDYADKSGEEYAAPAEYGDDYAWSSIDWASATADAAGKSTDMAYADMYKNYDGYDEYDYSDKETSWVADAAAAEPTYDGYDYEYSDKETTWVDEADASEQTGKWEDEDCDDVVPVVEECDDDVAGDSMVQIINVSDKDGNLAFSPNDIKAPVGSYVQFHFWPKVCLPTMMLV